MHLGEEGRTTGLLVVFSHLNKQAWVLPGGPVLGLEMEVISIGLGNATKSRRSRGAYKMARREENFRMRGKGSL